MDILREFDVHDARIISLTIQRLNRYLSAVLEMRLFDGPRIRILFDKIEKYTINAGGGQYHLEIDTYTYEDGAYRFNLHGENGTIAIKARRVILQK